MKTDQQIFEEIAAHAVEAAPKGWRKIIVSASMEDDNGETLYDYLDESGAQQWFVPETEFQYQVYLAFQTLQRLMRASNQQWKSVRFTVEESRKFKAEFDYEQ